MKLVSTFLMMRARTAAQLALSTLVLAAGCGDDEEPMTSDESTAGPTSDPTGSPTGSPTTDPQTTGDTDPATTGDTDPTTGVGTESGEVAPDYMTEIQPIWDMRCLVGCHIEGGNGALTSGLILSAGVSHGAIVNVDSVGAPSLKRIAPGDVDASYLWHKLKNTQVDVGGSGYQMPIGGLPDADVALIEAWIEGGALP